MTPKLELAKQRDFGELISDTFQFIKENFKPLLRVFFTFCGLFLVATAAGTILQQIKYWEAMGTMSNPGPYQKPSPLDFFGWEYVASLSFLFLTYNAINVTILSYIGIYKQDPTHIPTNQEVWGYFKYYYLRVFIAMFLLGILMGIAFVCCLIPGFYLYPILSLVYPIMIIENMSMPDSVSKAFNLIKENWWTVFGALVVIAIITWVGMMFFALPASIFGVASLFLQSQKGTSISVIGIAIATIVQILGYVVYIVPITTSALCYFSLNEYHEGTGLLSRINQLGNNNQSEQQPPEQY